MILGALSGSGSGSNGAMMMSAGYNDPNFGLPSDSGGSFIGTGRAYAHCCIPPDIQPAIPPDGLFGPDMPLPGWGFPGFKPASDITSPFPNMPKPPSRDYMLGTSTQSATWDPGDTFDFIKETEWDLPGKPASYPALTFQGGGWGSATGNSRIPKFEMMSASSGSGGGGGIIQKAKSFVSKAYSSAKNAINRAVNTVKGAVNRAVGTVKKAVKKVKNAIGCAVESVSDSVETWARNKTDNGPDWAKSLVNKVFGTETAEKARIRRGWNNRDEQSSADFNRNFWNAWNNREFGLWNTAQDIAIASACIAGGIALAFISSEVFGVLTCGGAAATWVSGSPIVNSILSNPILAGIFSEIGYGLTAAFTAIGYGLYLAGSLAVRYWKEIIAYFIQNRTEDAACEYVRRKKYIDKYGPKPKQT